MAGLNTFTIRKNKKLIIPESLNLMKLWSLIGPTVAKEIGGPDYNPISSLMDCNAYYVGYIFVQTAGQVTLLSSKIRLG